MSNQRRVRRSLRFGTSQKSMIAAAAVPALLFGAGSGSPVPSVRASERATPVCSVTGLGGAKIDAHLDGASGELVIGGSSGVVLASPDCGESIKVVVAGVGKEGPSVVVPPRGESVALQSLWSDATDSLASKNAVTNDLFVTALPNGAVVASTEAFPAELDQLLSDRFPELGWEAQKRNADTGTVADGPSEPSGQAVIPPVDAAAQEGVPCVRTERNWSDSRESDNHAWRINKTTYPANLDAAQTTADLVAGMDGWEGFPRTDCLTVPLNSIRHNHLGGTALMPNITASGGCQSRDQNNVWAFRTLNESGLLALTCTWALSIPFATDEIQEADVAFNSNVSWGNEVNQCTPTVRKQMVSAVATHESGHVFGSNHVVQASQQTMVPQNSACSKDAYSLGRGDMIGAQEKYQP